VYSTVHVYIAEISPKKLRGLLVSLLNPAYNFGFLVAMSAKIGFAMFQFGWRLSSGTLGVLGIVYALGMLVLPHSPRYVGSSNCVCIQATIKDKLGMCSFSM